MLYEPNLFCVLPNVAARVYPHPGILKGLSICCTYKPVKYLFIWHYWRSLYILINFTFFAAFPMSNFSETFPVWMCLFRSALISLFCKYWPACFILVTPLQAPMYHYLLWSVSPAVLINIILAYFENVGMCVICCKPAMYLSFLKNTKFKVIVSP